MISKKIIKISKVFKRIRGLSWDQNKLTKNQNTWEIKTGAKNKISLQGYIKI